MKLNILYQDDYYIAAEKPSGLLVHPYWKETNEKQSMMMDLKRQIGKWIYPIHRLDRPVSGVVLFGLVPEAVKEIQAKWADESTKKKYVALVRDTIYTEVTRFEFSLKNDNKIPQEALTIATPLEHFEDSTLMEVEIKTGRKHQIRRHFSRRCTAVAGDRMYGKKPFNDRYLNDFGLQRIFLHAQSLSFIHPFSSEEIEITCPLPDDLSRTLENIRRSGDR